MFFGKTYGTLLGCAMIAGLAFSTAQAGTLEVYKLGVNATGANSIGDVVSGWQTPGSFGSNPSLTDASTDYRNSWVDDPTNWASVTSIDVGMYDANGNEVAYFDFAGPDTVQGAGVTVSSFFNPNDLIATNYTDVLPFGGNYFSENGDTQRKFFVQNNYGGCGNDTGWLVLDQNGGEGCSWESTQQNGSGSQRAFLYALNDTRQNWNNNGILNDPNEVGNAPVFAITVTSALVPASTPEPSTILTLGGALGALGFLRLRRRRG